MLVYKVERELAKALHESTSVLILVRNEFGHSDLQPRWDAAIKSARKLLKQYMPPKTPRKKKSRR